MGKETSNFLTRGKIDIQAQYGILLGSNRNMLTFCGESQVIFLSMNCLVRVNLITGVREAECVAKKADDISLIHVPKDNLNLTMIGYAQGAIRIKDTKTLSNVLFTYNLPNDQCSVVQLILHQDRFCNVVVVQSNFEVTNLRLRNDSKKGAFELYSETNVRKAFALVMNHKYSSGHKKRVLVSIL